MHQMRSVTVPSTGLPDVRERRGIPHVASAILAAHRWGFLEWFVICQTALPAALFLPGSQSVRMPLRIAPFALSLVALAWCLVRSGGEVRPHPARWWLLLVVIYLGVMILAPTTNSFIAGTAHVVLYLSVFAPVFWVPRLVGSPERLRRLLAILFVCNGINAVVGVLQVYDPGHWMPAEFSRLVMTSQYGLDSVSYVGPDGVRIVRPPGLFDNPGAVCGPGMVAALLGLIFFVSPIKPLGKVFALLLSLAGVVAMYLSYVRTTLLVLIGMALIYLLTLVMLKRPAAAARFGIAVSAVAAVGLSLSVLLAGESVIDRFSTLLEDDPLAVYYRSGRGSQLEDGFTNLLSEYPLGAGLGRWGMIHRYFGDQASLNSPSIWVELQPNAWIIDGGIFLLAVYSTALLVTAVREFRIMRAAGGPSLRVWAAPIFALNIGTLVLVFGFTPFTNQVGLQYWFLVGLLHGAAQTAGTPANDPVRSR